MTVELNTLAVIPARGGSKGLPGKNIRPFVGTPLIAHSIKFSLMCPEIDRCIVSTDSAEIAEVATRYGGDVPFLRPAELAQDETSLIPVLQHALDWVEETSTRQYDVLLLLDPTSPAREPSDLSGALRRLEACPQADGVIGVSEPEFNPIWHCVVERDGWMENLIDGATQFERRQDVPTVYRINGSIYLWRTGFLRNLQASWRQGGRLLMYQVPEVRAMSFDTIEEFQRAEMLVKAGIINLPWLNEVRP